MVPLTRRSLFTSSFGVAAGALVYCWSSAAGAADFVLVTDYRYPGDVDDSAAFRRAIAVGRPIRVPAGGGSSTDGSYVIEDVSPAAGSVIFGDGIGKTVIRPRRTELPGQNAAFHCDSGSPSSWISNIRISNLTLEGWVAEQGFSEHQHLIHLNGVDNVLIEDVEFRAFQGDGLHLGSSRKPDTERHNRRVTVRRCVFDGFNNQNRNAISVIDGDRVLVEQCLFRNCTRSNMPGAIDFEPDSNSFAVIRRIVVRNCRFQRIGGNVGVIAFHIPAAVAALPSKIEILDNVFESYRGGGAEIYLNVNRGLEPRDPDMEVSITGNRGSGGQSVYAFYAAKGVTATGNNWSDYDQASSIGYIEARQVARNVFMRDTFVRCGSVGAVGMYVYNVSGFELDGTEFVDCGNGGPNAYALSFGQGRSEHVTLRNLRVRSPSGRTRIAVIREQLHRFSPATNSEIGNDFGGLPALNIASWQS